MNQAVIVTDWDKRGWDNLEKLKDKLGNALVEITDLEPAKTAKGELRETKRVVFDDSVRNTHAHGWATSLGYVAHTEYPDKEGHWYTR